jgi:hypothetical protein
MSNKRPKLLGTIIGVISAAIFIVAATWAVFNRQYVLDQITVWSYEPSSAIASINQRSGFSDKGTFYFYTSQPVLESASDFNNSCQRQEANSAILGCYTNKRIFLYDVTNQQLDGVEEVTAAHEMLHAVWQRMGDSEKQIVSNELEEAFAKINNPKLNERMAYYDRTEPGERTNELHSILATEYRNLGSTLEAHYAKYFSDRNKIIDLHDAYQAVFDDLKKQSDALEAEMETIRTSINTKTDQYNTEAASISSDVTALNNSLSSVDVTSQSEVNAYNARRQALINRANALETVRRQINALTDTYNDKIAAYNKLVVSTNELNKSLDSTLAPAPTL